MQYAPDLAMPTLEELEWFTRCAVVPEENIAGHLRRIELDSLAIGTRVRLCGLEGLDYEGYIEDIHDDAFDITRLLGSGATMRVNGACVFRWFHKGDRVQVLAGPHKGRIAWVTAVDDDARTAVLYDHAKEEEFPLSFHFMGPAPDDRQFAPDTLSISNKGKQKFNVPEVPAVTIKEPIRMSKDSLFKLLQNAEVMVARGDCKGQKGRVLEAESASIITVKLQNIASPAVDIRIFRANVLQFRLDPAGPYFELGSDLVLRPVASVAPAVVYQKLKGLDVLVIKGMFKGRRGKIHDVEETGMSHVDFSAANTSSSDLPEIRAEDMLYRYFPGGAYMELDDKKELVPAPHADKLIKDGFIGIDDTPDPNEPNYQLDVQRWVTGWESIEGRRMEREKQLWSARPTDKIPDGHFFTLLKDGALKEKPGWKVVFKVRTDIPELAGATHYEGYFVDIEKDIVILHDVNEDSPFPVIRQPYQALVPSPPQNIKEWVVVCDPDIAKADGSAYFVREIGLDYSWVTTSSRKSTDRRRVKTKMMARMIAPPRNREKERNRPRILVFSSVGSAGLNLAIADVVILFDQPWSSQDECQIIGRAHRQPQQKEVKAIYLHAKDSADVLIWEMARGKSAMFDAFVDKEKAAATVHFYKVKSLMMGNWLRFRMKMTTMIKTQLDHDDDDDEGPLLPTMTAMVSPDRLEPRGGLDDRGDKSLSTKMSLLMALPQPHGEAADSAFGPSDGNTSKTISIGASTPSIRDDMPGLISAPETTTDNESSYAGGMSHKHSADNDRHNDLARISGSESELEDRLAVPDTMSKDAEEEEFEAFPPLHSGRSNHLLCIRWLTLFSWAFWE
ncbi:hypothetical protein NP233_g13031 [Leucocoprinus birnbaumii]|uniref:Helicase C-terminal domain-containing protein n=1 Tax=Leucocoprinus birnbaumii TaxID=56174 RepID=A0AAD5YJV8_9AGAR|nr:hypothetical protein NP233_g13031 [Leucocoprinus birnbaumii]